MMQRSAVRRIQVLVIPLLVLLLAACGPADDDNGVSLSKIMQATTSVTPNDDNDDDGNSTRTQTITPSATLTPTATNTPTSTSTPTATATATATATSTPAQSGTPGLTPTPTLTRTPGGGIIYIIEGPVTAININIITIYDFDIFVEDDDPALTVIRIGDIIRVAGEWLNDDFGNDDDDDDDDGRRRFTLRFIAVTIIFINVDVVIIDGLVWRDLGDCAAIPGFVTRENARRYFARCIDRGNQGGGNQGGGNNNNDDDDDDDDD